MKKKPLALLLAAVLLLALLPVTASASGSKLIAFTFDDGPNRYTAGLLDGLEARGVVATFFMNGANGAGGTSNYPELLARMREDGDQLANHTYSHASFSRLSAEKMKSEVAGVEAYLFDAMGGSYTDFVRTPGGAVNSAVRGNVDAPIILWSVDPVDWKYRNADTDYKNVVRGAKDGAIVLMHDLYKPSVEAALRAIDTLKERGYEFVTVAELLRRRGITPQAGHVYTSAPDSGVDLPAYCAPVLASRTDYAACAAEVTLTSPDGVQLYYTTDGTTPTLASAKYTGPFLLRGDVTVTAAGIDGYGTRTPLCVQAVRGRVVPAPAASYAGGKLTLTCAEGALIRYTTDGSDPTGDSPVYTEPFAPGVTTKCFAAMDGCIPSRTAVYTLTTYGSLYSDVSAASWYYPDVGRMDHEGLMTGVGGGRFDPDGTMTRAMLAAVLWKRAGKPSVTGAQPFSDVAADAWYAGAVRWASREGLMNGVDGGLFDPDAPLTREQLAAVFARSAKRAGLDTSGKSDLSGFTDASGVSPYAADAMGWCVKSGLIGGTDAGALEPRGAATRAQCAAILARFEKLLPNGNGAKR